MCTVAPECRGSYKKGRTITKAKSLPMRIASSKATKDFAGYSEQAVSQPALHSRILQKRPHMRASLFICLSSGVFRKD